MIWLRKLRTWLCALFAKRKLDAEMDEEMRAHIEMQTQENIEAGMEPEEAHYAALRQFGHSERIKETCRERRGVSRIEHLVYDLRFSARMIWKQPGFTAVAVLSLALGLAVNTAVFTFFNAMNLRPVPGVKEPERIVFPDRSYWYFSLSEVEHIRGNNSVFSHVVGLSRARVVVRRETDQGLDAVEAAEPARVLLVSESYFDALGVDAPQGRYFLRDEHQGAGVAVVSHECWKRRFDSDPRLIGRTVLLNGAAFAVVGIGPEEFPGAEPFFAQRADFWLPLRAQPLLQPGKSFLGDPAQKRIQLFARLKPGATLPQAKAEMAVLEDQLAAAFPENISSGDARSRRSWSKDLTAGYRFRLLEGEEMQLAILVQAISIIVLLVASANGANLLLARAAARTREMGIRVALGATRRRLLRQWLTESILLGVMAGVAGLLLSTWSCGLMRSFLLGEVNQYSQAETPLLDLDPDMRILLFALGLSAAAGLVMGLLPALRASRPDACDALKGEMPGAALGIRPSRWRDAMIVSQFTVSLVLLVAAGLLVRIAWQGIHREYRVDVSRGLLVSVDFWSKGYDDARIVQSQLDLVRQAPLMPGIESAALISHLHAGDYHGPPPLFVEERHEAADTPGLSPYPTRVTPEFFKTMGMPILHGRGFMPEDTDVLIVSEAMARRLWPGRSALGRRLKVGENAVFAEVVGVVASAFDRSVFEHAPSPARYTIAGFGSDLFLPWSRGSGSEAPRALLVVRHDGRPAIAASAFSVAAQTIVEPDVAVYTRPLRDVFEYWMKPFVLFARLGVVLGAIALLLAAVGLHGVIAYVVSMRTTEIGGRMAMGASRGHVLRLILRQSAVLVGWAMGIGLTLSLGAAFVIRTGIYGTLVWDPVVYLGPLAVLGLVALAASIPPALRAANIDPLEALRHE